MKFLSRIAICLAILSSSYVHAGSNGNAGVEMKDSADEKNTRNSGLVSTEQRAGRTKSKQSTKAFDLPIGKLWIDPSDWSKSVDGNVEGAALELAHEEGDAFLAVISSPDFMPANDFVKAFVEGMDGDGSDVKKATLSKSRDIVVNGAKFTDITITAMVSRQSFVYRGYVYAGRKGVCLVLTWTHADLYDELKPDIEKVLDGYVVP